MNRRRFIKSTLLGASAFFIPNAVLAFDEKSKIDKRLDARSTFFTQPNLRDYKFNSDGTAFFQTKVGFRLSEAQTVFLPKEFRITHEQNGYGAPAFYSSGKKQYVFVSELFADSKMNGWIYEFDEGQGFTAHRAYQHENMGWYAFWGKPVNGKPALYHFNYKGFFVTQTAYLDGKWQTNRIYNTVPSEAVRLYEAQINHPDYPHQRNQFGFEWQVHPDGFYDFLKIKHEWEQSKLQAAKNEFEAKEAKQPSVASSLESERMTRVFRNRQCLANSADACGCNAVKQTSAPDARNLRIVKTQILKNGAVEVLDGDAVYQTRLGFYDERNRYREIPETLHCAADALGEKKPVLFGDGANYYLYAAIVQNGAERRFMYKFDERGNWSKEEITENQNWGAADFALLSGSDEPIIYQTNRKPTAEFVKARFEKTNISVTASSALTINKLLLQQRQTNQYTNPFVPIYCEGEDTSKALIKPTVIYKEVAGTKIEIPNMPAVKTQNELGECRAFALAALMQWYTCSTWKADIPDCKNPPADLAISYFGMMMYTHRDPEKNKTFQPDQDRARDMYHILNNIKFNGAKFILESCKPFDVMVTNFKAGTEEGKKKMTAFFDYLRKIYESNKGKIKTEIKNCPDCVKEINKNAGLNASVESLKKALLKESFDDFLYSMFFDGCELEPFPSSYVTRAYPHDGLSVTPAELKEKIIEVLKEGKPLLCPKICLEFEQNGNCAFGHAVIISGYKRVFEKNGSGKVKDVLKIHNSVGEEWQRINNGGWVDADTIVNSVYKLYNDKASKGQRVESQTILWLGS